MSPSEPAGQVPIGGLSLMPTAKAGTVSADGRTALPARPAPARSRVRRDTLPRFWSFGDIFFLLVGAFEPSSTRSLASLSGALRGLIRSGHTAQNFYKPTAKVRRSMPLWSMTRRSAVMQCHVHSFSWRFATRRVRCVIASHEKRLCDFTDRFAWRAGRRAEVHYTY